MVFDFAVQNRTFCHNESVSWLPALASSPGEFVMTASGKAAAALALHRFGFGPAGDGIAAIAGDPQGALLAELERPQAGLLPANLPSSGEAAREVFDFRAEQAAKQKLALRAQKQAENSADLFKCTTVAGAPCVAPPGNDAANAANQEQMQPSPAKPAQPPAPPLPQQLFQNEAKARFDTAASVDIGFTERLVWFWSNHFCVSADKIPAMAGPYEREAIRPHVLGRFADLLLAAESHPAMLFYLDNVESMGANSVAGINRDKGLNENLAREILELHTLGVRSGYTQQDVTSFANVITGWNWIAPQEPIHGGEFAFVQRLHEPGNKTVLGKVYPDTGVEQGRAVLVDLARHPATARHIAQKLAQHFVADEPPPSLIGKLETTFKNTDGDLKETAKTLVKADESWTPQRGKLKTPALWITAALRLTGVVPGGAIGRVLGAQASLGQALWRPPAPNGYPDTEAAWIDGIPRRLDIANELAGRVATKADPLALLDAGLGPLASSDTRNTVARAESRAQALALLLMAPEFLRS
jgi:uncharacterized protein (DUF1800 family)